MPTQPYPRVPDDVNHDVMVLAVDRGLTLWRTFT